MGRRTLADAVTVQAPLRPSLNASLPPPTRPYGAASSGVIGLLLGLLLAAGYGSRVLLERYETASATLQESVDALRSSTEQLVPIVQRVDRLERQLSELRSAAASTRDLEDLRRQLLRTVDAAQVDTVDLKAHLMGVESDVHQLIRNARTTIRI